MKRKDLIKILEQAGCFLKRNGGNHDIYFNSHTGKTAPVPGHNEISDSLCKLILKQLKIS
ncbi:MAG: type II toxin-antitoxin system HicA family toxin [Candidatus Caenarcaniphilales bacterium]|nr:type II toxin-antitoxin system HicA family toxin [Candidatus Caenarcaniphilales bacterium]